MKKERMYGLGILRILSMIGIIGLHIMNNGGISFISSYCRSWYRLFARRYFCAFSISLFVCRQGHNKCSNSHIPNSIVMAFFRSGFFAPSIAMPGCSWKNKPAEFERIIQYCQAEERRISWLVQTAVDVWSKERG